MQRNYHETLPQVLYCREENILCRSYIFNKHSLKLLCDETHTSTTDIFWSKLIEYSIMKKRILGQDNGANYYYYFRGNWCTGERQREPPPFLSLLLQSSPRKPGLVSTSRLV